VNVVLAGHEDGKKKRGIMRIEKMMRAILPEGVIVSLPLSG
jgi:hypothetical protein